MGESSQSPGTGGSTDIRELLRRQESLRQVIESISRELKLRPLLTLIVRHAGELVGAAWGAIGLVDREHGLVRTEAAFGPAPQAPGAESPIGVGLAGQVVLQGCCLALESEGEANRPVSPRGSDYIALSVPVHWRGAITGVFEVGATLPGHLRAQDVETLTIFAHHAAIAIENARLQGAFDQARQLYETSHERGQQLAVLKERQRLARELHDSVTQLLFSITLIAQSIAPAWRRNPAEGERRINRLLELSQSALAEMRILLAELRPPEPVPAALQPAGLAANGPEPPAAAPAPGILRLPVDGLVEVLRRHVADLAQDGPRIILDTAGYAPQSPELEEALYRITQEALNNVIKHAHARTVRVKLCLDTQVICLLVTDDGLGFAPQVAEAGQPSPSRIYRPGGLGLSSMVERAEALGGTIHLAAAPDAGTTVIAVIPRKDRRP